MFIYNIPMGEAGEGLTKQVADALTRATADNHDARVDPAQTAAGSVVSGMGGDKLYREDMEEIASDLARKAQKATFVNAQGVGRPSRRAAGFADVERVIAEAKARKRAKQSEEKTSHESGASEDPMAASARSVLSQPWEPTKQ